MSDPQAPSTTIPVVDTQSGELTSVAPKDLQQALTTGFRQATADDIHAFQQKQQYGEGLGNELLAGAAGAARGATFGLSDQALTKTDLVNPETLSALQQYNPVSSGVGEAAGVIAPAVLSDGASLAADGAVGAGEVGAKALGATDLLNPVGAVSKVGKAVTEGVSPYIKGALGIAENPETASLAKKVLASSASHALGSAVEGTAYGLGQSVSEDALGDPNLNGEKVLSNIGYGALLGGALGGAIEAGSVAVPAALKSASKSLQKLTGAEDSELGALGNAYTKAASFVSGKDEGTIRDALVNRDKSLVTPEDIYGDSKAFSDDLTNHVDQMNKLTKTNFSEIRPQEVEETLKGVDPFTAQQQASNTVLKLQDAVKQMEAKPSYFPEMVRGKLADIQSDFENSIKDAKNPADIYNSINDLKQQLDKRIQFGKLPGPEYQDSISLLKGLRADIKTSLENEDVWGVTGARQAAFNDAQNSYLTAQKEFNKAFGAKSITKTGSQVVKVNPAKVDAFIKSSGTVRSEVKKQILDDYLSASKNLIDETEKSYQSIPGKSFDKKSAQALVDRTSAISAKAAQQAEYNKTLNYLGAGAHNTPFAEGGALAVGALGHPALGAAVEGFNLLKAPGLAIQRLAKIERMTQNVTNSITNASKAIFNTASSAGQKLAPYAGASYASKDDKKSLSPDKIQDLANNPDKLISALDSSTSALHQVAPNTAGSIQRATAIATQFLSTKIPTNPNRKPLSPKFIPSPAEISKFNRYYQTIENPTHVLHGLKTGMIMPENMEALASVYPNLLQHMQSQVMDQLTNWMSKNEPSSLPYKKKMALSMFLGTDLDSSLDQQSIASNQALMTGQKSAQDQLANPIKPTETGQQNLNFASRSMTATQNSANDNDNA